MRLCGEDKEKIQTYIRILNESLLIAKENGNRDVNENDIQIACKKLLKKAKQSADYGMNVSVEIAIYKSFLPKELSNDEMYDIISSMIDNGVGNIGQIMKNLRNIPGINMKRAKEIVDSLLKKGN